VFAPRPGEFSSSLGLLFASAKACNVWLSGGEEDAIANRLNRSYDQEVILVDFCRAVNTLTVNTAETAAVCVLTLVRLSLSFSHHPFVTDRARRDGDVP
jgi:hypothetical protein